MGLRPLLGASAFFAVPVVLRWPALIIMITTMMIGAQPVSFKYEGKASLEFFLKQCRVRAQSYRRKELPLNNVPAWRGAAGEDIELSGLVVPPEGRIRAQ